jgi:group I intron endonuclease
MIGIYKITSPSGRIYIGQSIDIKRRFNTYKSLNKSKHQVKLNNSFKKHDIDNHIFEIIEECDINLLNERERYWQEFYDSTNKKTGLNCLLTSTLNSPGVMSESTKNKIRESKIKLYSSDYENPLKGRRVSKESIDKRTETIKNKYKNGYVHPNKGKKASDESKLKMSEAQKKLYENGYVNPNKGKKASEELKKKLSIAQLKRFENEAPTNLGRKRTVEEIEKQKLTWAEKYANGYISPSKGVPVPEDKRKIISETLKSKYENGEITHYMIGKTHKIETKEKISESRKAAFSKGLIIHNAKIVIDLETGIFYNSASECWLYNQNQLNIKQKSFDLRLRNQKNKGRFQYA